MPLGRYVEKYELNGKSSQSYGSISSCETESQVILRNKDDMWSESDVNDQQPNSTDFRDQKSKIDYIITYEEWNGSEYANPKQQLYRERYLSNLRASGLELDEDIIPLRLSNSQSRNNFIHFIKLKAPWNLLCYYAEQLCIRAPLQSVANTSDNWSDLLFRYIRCHNPMYQFVPNKPQHYYTCYFKKSKLHQFLGSDNHDDYFTTTQRIRIVHEILQTVCFGKKSLAQIGIDSLIEEQIFNSAFPIHDGPFEVVKQVSEPQYFNKRQILYYYWAQWSKWYKYQPLDHIKDYFGEKIAIYFAWLGFYTAWLVPAAFFGLFVFLYGLFNINNDIPSSEICKSGETYKMCPICNGCYYWFLSEVCLFSKLSVMFDNTGTVLYAIFMSFWAVSFLEYWKRKSASLSHHWDSIDFDEEERVRPKFGVRAPYMNRNSITGINEPSFPRDVRYFRMTAGFITLCFMLILVFIFMMAVIVYRILISIPLFEWKKLRPFASLISTSSGAFVNLLLIMCLGRVYEKLAYKLTEWEMHRTQSQFDNHLALKVCVFQFFNFYSSAFYIAFFKGQFSGRPGHYRKFLGLRYEECCNYGCLMELTQQLAIIMIGKQVINNCREILIPRIQSWFHKKRTNMETINGRITQWELDFQLIPYEGLFEEYLEMILQFGFITIFVAAFPLAPLFALINNWFEIRLDAQKLVCYTRRPVPESAKNIGIWFDILNFLSHIAVISNAFLIAFSSEFLPKMLYRYDFNWASLSGYVNYTLAIHVTNHTNLTDTCLYRDFYDHNNTKTLFYWKLMFVRLAFIVIFEHFVFSISKFIDLLVPDIPYSIECKIKRERYLAKQALTDSHDLFEINK